MGQPWDSQDALGMVLRLDILDMVAIQGNLGMVAALDTPDTFLTWGTLDTLGNRSSIRRRTPSGAIASMSGR